MNKWDKRYLNLAKDISTWSKDPRRKFGAVIVGDDKQIISQGYNGFPRGIKDTPERYNDRVLKNKYIIHAEANAIFNAALNGSNIKGATMYVSGDGLMCCHDCAKAIVQSGIKKVVVEAYSNEDWEESAQLGKELFIEAGVKYIVEDKSEGKTL